MAFVVLWYQDALDDKLLPKGVCGRVDAGASLFRTLTTLFVYNALDAFLPGDGGFTVFQKVVVHQCMWMPFSYCFAIVWWNMNIWRGTRPSEIVTTVMPDLEVTIINAWSYLTLPLIINFGYVEPKYRILCSKLIDIALYSVLVIFGRR